MASLSARDTARTVGAGRRQGASLLAFFVCSMITLLPTVKGMDAGDAVNVAAAAEGGIAVALFSQDTFEATLAIDGALDHARGWAYYGRMEVAAVVFAFDGAHDVSRVRVISGHGMSDHHITAFQLWAYYPKDLFPSPPAEAGSAASVSASTISSAIRQKEEFESAALRLSLAQLEQGLVPQGSDLPVPSSGWTLIRGVQGTVSCTALVEQGVSGTIMAKGNGTSLANVEVEFATRRALAFKLVVRDADSPTKNAVLTEFEVWASRREALHDSRPGETCARTPSAHTQDAHTLHQQDETVVIEGPVGAPLAVRILSPEDGASLLRAPLRVAISGADFGPEGVRMTVGLWGGVATLIVGVGVNVGVGVDVDVDVEVGVNVGVDVGVDVGVGVGQAYHVPAL